MVKMEMSLFTKFSFDVSFDEPTAAKIEAALTQHALPEEMTWEEENVIEEEAPPPPPTFSEEDLELAKKLSFEEGREVGMSDAKASIEQKQLELLQRLSEQLLALTQTAETEWQQFHQQSVAVGVAMAKALCPTWMQAAKHLEITTMLQTLLPALVKEQHIHIAIAPNDVVWLEQTLLTMLQQQGCTVGVRVEPRDTLAAGDIVITGEHSSALRMQALVWEKVKEHTGE